MEASNNVESPFLSTYYGSYANHSLGEMFGSIAMDFSEGSAAYINNWDKARDYLQAAYDGFKRI